MKGPPETAKLKLVDFRDEDAPAIYKMLTDDYARQFHPDTHKETAQRWVSRNQKRYADDGIRFDNLPDVVRNRTELCSF